MAGILFSMISCQKETIDSVLTVTNQTTPNEPNNPTTNIPTINTSTTKNLVVTNNSPSDLTLLQYLKGENDYTIFYQALIRTGLNLDILGDGPFTIFVPSNEAFQTYFDNNNFNSLDDISQNILTKIIKFHVANVKVKLAELEIGTVIPLFLTGKEMYINMDNPTDPFLVLGASEANFIERDLEHTNGVVHKINGVLEL